jgi:PEGA domain
MHASPTRARDRASALLACAVAIATAWRAPPVAAGEPTSAPSESPAEARVLLLAPIWSGDVPASHRETIAAGFERSLAAGGTIAIRDDGAACAAAPCRRERMRVGGLTLAIGLEVRAVDRDYRVRALLFDGLDGRVIGDVEETCRICGVIEVAALAGDQALALQDKLTNVRSQAILGIDTTPAGAQIIVDGTRAGSSPVMLRLAAGEHRITASLPGRPSVSRRVELVARVRERIELVLPFESRPVESSSATELTAADHRRRALVGSGGALLVVGTGVIAGSVPLFLRHGDAVAGRCAGLDRDYLGHCRYVHDTRAGAIAMAIVGAAVLATGITLLGIATARRRSRVRSSSSRHTSHAGAAR